MSGLLLGYKRALNECQTECLSVRVCVRVSVCVCKGVHGTAHGCHGCKVTSSWHCQPRAKQTPLAETHLARVYTYIYPGVCVCVRVWFFTPNAAAAAATNRLIGVVSQTRPPLKEAKKCRAVSPLPPFSLALSLCTHSTYILLLLY